MFWSWKIFGEQLWCRRNISFDCRAPKVALDLLILKRCLDKITLKCVDFEWFWWYFGLKRCSGWWTQEVPEKTFGALSIGGRDWSKLCTVSNRLKTTNTPKIVDNCTYYQVLPKISSSNGTKLDVFLFVGLFQFDFSDFPLDFEQFQILKSPNGCRFRNSYQNIQADFRPISLRRRRSRSKKL